MDDDLREVEKRVAALEVAQAAVKERLAHGMSQGAADQFQNVQRQFERTAQGISQGASEQFNQVQRQLDKLRDDLSKQNDQIKRWQGGSAVIYMIVAAFGSAIGWLLSHFTGGVH